MIFKHKMYRFSIVAMFLKIDAHLSEGTAYLVVKTNKERAPARYHRFLSNL